MKGGVHNKRGRQVKFASQTWVPKNFSNKTECSKTLKIVQFENIVLRSKVWFIFDTKLIEENTSLLKDENLHHLISSPVYKVIN